MERAAGEAAAARQPHDDRHREAEAVVRLAGDVDELVEAAATKSANCISHTGRMPTTAAPTAVPTIADSASGVSITRVSPNSSTKPSVTLKAPPNAPTSSPITKHALVRAQLLAQRVGDRLEVGHRRHQADASAVAKPLHGARPSPSGSASPRANTPRAASAGSGIGAASASAAAASTSLVHLGAQRRDVDAERGDAPLLTLDRVALGPRGEQLRRHVAHVVVRGVAVHAHRHRLDERRAFAGQRPRTRGAHRLEHRLGVVAVDRHAREAVTRARSTGSTANCFASGVE